MALGKANAKDREHPAARAARLEQERQELELASAPLTVEAAVQADAPQKIADSLPAAVEPVSGPASEQDMPRTEERPAGQAPSNVVTLTSRSGLPEPVRVGQSPRPSDSVRNETSHAPAIPDREATASDAQPEAGHSEAGHSEVTQPEVTQPEVTQPEVAQPEVAQPEAARVRTQGDTRTTGEGSASPAVTSTGRKTPPKDTPASASLRPASQSDRTAATRAPNRTSDSKSAPVLELIGAVVTGTVAPMFDGAELVMPEQPPANVARVKASKRGKRDVNYSWPKVDYAVMQSAWEQAKPVYSRAWRQQDPGGAYRLGFSAFVATAMLEAFKDVDAWIDTIRNDGRLEPVAGGRQQVGLVWPVEVENQVIDLWETMDRSRFPSGFSLTKQHLAAAAILHGLKSAPSWLMRVGNDDRFSIPVEGDGRLRSNRPEPEPAPAH